jgi:mannosyltransferase
VALVARPRHSVRIASVLVGGGALAVACLALTLRLYRLAAQSLWYDEGISLNLAGRGLSDITRSALADIHPPIYYYLLHFWTRLAGNSEFSARFLSATAGAFAVCLLYQLGRQLFSRAAGLCAAAFLAVAPVAVYYGQEARMYSLLLALTLLWTLLWLRLLVAAPGDWLGRHRRLGWALYGLLGVICLYTHYLACLILAVQAVGTVVLGPRRLRQLLGWLALEGAIGVAFLPWLLNMSFGQIDSFRRGAAQPTVGEVLWRMLDDFSVGHLALPDENVRLLFLGLLAVGLLSGGLWARWRWRAGILALLYAGLPVAAMLMISSQRPAYVARLMLEAAPGLYLLLGAGVAALGLAAARLAARFGLGQVGNVAASAAVLWFALSPLTPSLQSLYFAEGWQRDDFRGAVAYLAANAKPEDAIVLDAPGQVDLFRYYFRGQQTYYPLPQYAGAPAGKPRESLAAIAAKHPNVWGIFWGDGEADPERVVEGWLDAHTYKTMNPWYGGIRLVRYVVGASGQESDLNVRFGDTIRLRAYSWQGRSGQPGEVLPLTLYWEATGPITARYKVFVHILDQNEKIWGQRDSEPGGGSAPTESWQTGNTVEDRIGLPIQPDAAPGQYQVELGLYDAKTMERPPVFDVENRPLGNRVLIGPIEVK